DGVALFDTTTLDTALAGLLVEAAQDARAGRTKATGHTHHPQRGAVYPLDPVGGYTTLLVDTGDILGAEGMQAIGEIHGGTGPVGGVGFGFSCLVGTAPQPHLSAHVHIAHVGVDVRQCLRTGVGGPQPLRAPEVGDAGVGGYARSG